MEQSFKSFRKSFALLRPIRCQILNTPGPGLDFKLALAGIELGESIVRAPSKCTIIGVDENSHGALMNLKLDCGLIVTLEFPPPGADQNLKQEPQNLSSLVNKNLERGDQIMRRSALCRTGIDTTARIFYSVNFTIKESTLILSIEYLPQGTKRTEQFYDLVIVNLRSSWEAAQDPALPADVENTVSNRTDLAHWYPIGPAQLHPQAT